MLEIIHNDIHCAVAIHPILSEEQCKNQVAPVIKVKSHAYRQAGVKRKCEWFTTHKVLHEMLREPVTYVRNNIYY